MAKSKSKMKNGHGGKRAGAGCPKKRGRARMKNLTKGNNKVKIQKHEKEHVDGIERNKQAKQLRMQKLRRKNRVQVLWVRWFRSAGMHFRLLQAQWERRKATGIAAFRVASHDHATRVEAAAAAARMIINPFTLKPVHHKSILRWVQDFSARGMDALSAGKRPAQWILAEYPELQNKARHWIRSKAWHMLATMKSTSVLWHGSTR